MECKQQEKEKFHFLVLYRYYKTVVQVDTAISGNSNHNNKIKAKKIEMKTTQTAINKYKEKGRNGNKY